MMSMTCHNLDLSRSVLDLAACGCSSNASSFERCSSSLRRSYVRTSSIKRGSFGDSTGGNLVYFRRKSSSCPVFSTKTHDTVLNGISRGPSAPAVLDVKEESRSPVLLSNLFEVVADDLQSLNQNLRSLWCLKKCCVQIISVENLMWPCIILYQPHRNVLA